VRAGVLLAGVLVAGCAPAAPEVRLTAASEYGRHAAVQGKVDLYVANRGTVPVEVVAYQVRHPMFEVVPATERASTLPPGGQELITPVAFGAPRCGTTSAGSAQVAVRLASGEELLLPLPDREPGLLRAHRLACAAEAVEAVAAVSLGPLYVRDGGVVRTVLRLERRSPGAVVVPELLSSILFSIDAARLELPAGAAAAEVPVVVTATRCDRHALVESKTAFTFPYLAAVDGGEPARLSVTARPEGRAVLQALLDDACGTGQ
jgi:hypothetical protein